MANELERMLYTLTLCIIRRLEHSGVLIAQVCRKLALY